MPRQEIYKCPYCGAVIPPDYDMCADCDDAYDYEWYEDRDYDPDDLPESPRFTLADRMRVR